MKRNIIFTFIFLLSGIIFMNFNVSAIYADMTEHSHCICGDKIETSQNHSHSKVKWEPLPSDFTGGTLNGYYYLTQNINLKSSVVGNYSICLNGHTMNADVYRFSPNYQSTLNICDCSIDNTGEIKTSSGNSGLIRYMGTNTNIYGGTINAYNHIMYNNNADVYTSYSSNLKIYGGIFNSEIGHCITADLHNKGTNEIVIYGGQFSSNSSTSAAIELNKGYISFYNGSIKSNYYGILAKKSANVNFHGGRIEAEDYGIYNYDEKGQISVDGGDIISDNTAIRNRSGNLVISNGAMTSKKNECIFNDSGTVEIKKGSIISEENDGIGNISGRISLTGGSIKAKGKGISNAGVLFMGNNPLIESDENQPDIYLSQNSVISVGDSANNKLNCSDPYSVDTLEKPTSSKCVHITGRLNNDFSKTFTSFNPQYLVVQNEGIVQLKLAEVYKIVYKPGKEGIGAEQAQDKYENSDVNLKESIFSRKGFRQTGWSTTENGSKEFSFDEKYEKNCNLILYPSWEENKLYTVKFVAQTKNGNQYQNSTTGGNVTLSKVSGYAGDSVSSTATSNDRYHFVGWFEKDGTIISNNNSYTMKLDESIEELTIYARFDPDNESIPVNPDNAMISVGKTESKYSSEPPDTGDIGIVMICLMGMIVSLASGWGIITYKRKQRNR